MAIGMCYHHCKEAPTYAASILFLLNQLSTVVGCIETLICLMIDNPFSNYVQIVCDLQFLQTDIDDFALSKQKEAMRSHNF